MKQRPADTTNIDAPDLDPGAAAGDLDNVYDSPVAPAAIRVWDEIKRLGLGENIGELEVLGYTVVQPEKVASPEFIVRMREAILDVAQRRTGKRPPLDLETSHEHSAHYGPGFGQSLPFILFEDPVFQEALLNPVLLAFVTYLLGRNAILHNGVGFIKGRGTDDLMLHTDNTLIGSPFPSLYQICNVSYVLTDYSLANGCLSMVPGSHRFCRHPRPGEGLDQRVPVEVPAGSLVIWSGHMWHGAYGRTAPGLRVNLPFVFARPHLRGQEAYSEHVTQEMLDRYPPRFKTLMSRDLGYGWAEEGPPQDISAFSMGRHAYD